MSKKFLTTIDLSQNKVVNVAVPTDVQDAATKGYVDTAATNAQNRANHVGTQLASTISDFDSAVQAFGIDQFATPVSAVNFNGQQVINLGTPTANGDAANKSYVDAGVVDAKNRSTHTGTQLASTISDFSAAVQATRLDQFAAPTASVALNNQRITSLAAPTSDTDAATKGYVDAAVNGTDWKQSVRAATTENIILSGTQTIDGVSLVAGNRVLVKNQTNAPENGLYVVASGLWSRTVDADTEINFTAGLSVMVEEGSTQADTQWRVITDGAIALGTTNIAFAQIGAGTSYISGNGINIDGNTVSVDASVVSRKYSTTIGGSTSAAVTHGLNTLDVQVQAYLVSTGESVECDVLRNSTSQVTLGFAVAPEANSIRVVVIG